MAAATLQIAIPNLVLVVDDEHGVCDLIGDVLEHGGFEVRCVHNDRAAHAALASGLSYAALVVDINLGAGTTGFDVARVARQLHPKLPVIYLSGQAGENSVATFGVAGSEFVSKPFKPDDLLLRLRDLLERTAT